MSQSEKSQKPQIIPLPNGPYYYFTKFDPKPVDGITNSKGEKLSTKCFKDLSLSNASNRHHLKHPNIYFGTLKILSFVLKNTALTLLSFQPT
jgi:hypothetical protein